MAEKSVKKPVAKQAAAKKTVSKPAVAKKPAAKKAAPKRRTSTVRSRMRTRTPRRKIDSDIIGGINFD